MQPGARRAYILLGVIGVIEALALIVLVVVPSSKTSSITHPNQTTMELTSTAFAHQGSIPAAYTCDGSRGTNPPLQIKDVPQGAATLVLVMDDPDVPRVLKADGVFDHWVLYNIPPDTTEIPQGASVGSVGINGAGTQTYTGPCPPKDYEPSEHRYVFTLYATDVVLQFEQAPTKSDVLSNIQGHIIAQTELIGLYKKQ